MQLNKIFVNKASTEMVVIAFTLLIISLQYCFASGDDLSPIVYASGKTNDKSGVLEIYPTAPGGQTWFFNPTSPADGQFDAKVQTSQRMRMVPGTLSLVLQECWHSQIIQGSSQTRQGQTWLPMTTLN